MDACRLEALQGKGLSGRVLRRMFTKSLLVPIRMSHKCCILLLTPERLTSPSYNKHALFYLYLPVMFAGTQALSVELRKAHAHSRHQNRKILRQPRCLSQERKRRPPKRNRSTKHEKIFHAPSFLMKVSICHWTSSDVSRAPSTALHSEERREISSALWNRCELYQSLSSCSYAVSQWIVLSSGVCMVRIVLHSSTFTGLPVARNGRILLVGR
jgi:hypothetical protein